MSFDDVTVNIVLCDLPLNYRRVGEEDRVPQGVVYGRWELPPMNIISSIESAVKWCPDSFWHTLLSSFEKLFLKLAPFTLGRSSLFIFTVLVPSLYKLSNFISVNNSEPISSDIIFPTVVYIFIPSKALGRRNPYKCFSLLEDILSNYSKTQKERHFG